MRFRGNGILRGFGGLRRNVGFPGGRLRVSAFRPRRRTREAGRLLLIALLCIILFPLVLPLLKLAIVLLFAFGTVAALFLLLALIRFLWLWWR